MTNWWVSFLLGDSQNGGYAFGFPVFFTNFKTGVPSKEDTPIWDTLTKIWIAWNEGSGLEANHVLVYLKPFDN